MPVTPVSELEDRAGKLGWSTGQVTVWFGSVQEKLIDLVTSLEVENSRLGGPIEKPKGPFANECRPLRENSRLAAGREIESRRIEKNPVTVNTRSGTTAQWDDEKWHKHPLLFAFTADPREQQLREQQ